MAECEHDWGIDQFTFSPKVIKFCKLCRKEIDITDLQICKNKTEEGVEE